jgi:hypothetical protein
MRRGRSSAELELELELAARRSPVVAGRRQRQRQRQPATRAHVPKWGCTQGGPATRRGCDPPLKNSKSAIKLLQVVLASAPTAKTRVFCV